VPPASGYVATVSRTGPWTRIRPSTDDERGIVAGCPQPEVGHPLRIDPWGPNRAHARLESFVGSSESQMFVEAVMRSTF
jgi:hypothetical protein